MGRFKNQVFYINRNNLEYFKEILKENEYYTLKTHNMLFKMSDRVMQVLVLDNIEHVDVSDNYAMQTIEIILFSNLKHYIRKKNDFGYYVFSNERGMMLDVYSSSEIEEQEVDSIEIYASKYNRGGLKYMLANIKKNNNPNKVNSEEYDDYQESTYEKKLSSSEQENLDHYARVLEDLYESKYEKKKDENEINNSEFDLNDKIKLESEFNEFELKYLTVEDDYDVINLNDEEVQARQLEAYSREIIEDDFSEYDFKGSNCKFEKKIEIFQILDSLNFDFKKFNKFVEDNNYHRLKNGTWIIMPR